LSNSSEEKKNENRKWMYLGAIGLTFLSKIKVILPMLSKLAVPVFSMLASILAYAWATKSWAIALGLVVMIFVHEAGHVLAAKRRGLPVTLPIFIPFLGAFIAMKKNPRDAITEAYIAIGGPLIGTLGALTAYLIGISTESAILIVVAYFGFFINLLNLLPIHPLDGGRIAKAVSRWLWLVGLIGGLVVIVYLRSVLFFIIWALFAWELYGKYVSKRKGRVFILPFQIKIPIEYLRMQGAIVPGEQHQRELEFSTYSSISGEQIVEIYWDSLGVREKVTLQTQCRVRGVKVVRVKHEADDNGQLNHIIAQCEINGLPYENDRYYEVPTSARWKFGVAYLGLAVFLILMMLSIQGMDIPGVR